MTYNRSEIMKTAWASAKATMLRLGYARHQLRALFVDALHRAWSEAKRAARMAQRSAENIYFEIVCLENKSRLVHADFLHLSTLRHALTQARARVAATSSVTA